MLKAAQGGIPLDYEHQQSMQLMQQEMSPQQQWLQGSYNNDLDFDDAARPGMDLSDIGLPIVGDDLERGSSRMA